MAQAKRNLLGQSKPRDQPAAPFRPPVLARYARQNGGPKWKSSNPYADQGEAKTNPNASWPTKQLPRKNRTLTHTRYTGAGRRVTGMRPVKRALVEIKELTFSENGKKVTQDIRTAVASEIRGFIQEHQPGAKVSDSLVNGYIKEIEHKHQKDLSRYKWQPPEHRGLPIYEEARSDLLDTPEGIKDCNDWYEVSPGWDWSTRE